MAALNLLRKTVLRSGLRGSNTASSPLPLIGGSSYGVFSGIRDFHGSSSVQAPAPTLSPKTIEIVKATAPVIAEHGYTITRTMYGRMLQDPEISALFNPTHQVEVKGEKAHQPWSLACAVHAYAANIDNLGALGEAVERIAQKHVSLSVLPEHYPIVGENVMWAIKEVLGDAATPEVMDAWGEAIGFLAHIFIERETQIREAKRDQLGGWEGWRDFKIVDKVIESSEIASLYLSPKDEGALLSYAPGSYTAVRLEIDGKATQRNYTLSKPAGNDGVWRITVKKEPAATPDVPPGRVSHYLHETANVGDTLELAVPCGDFTLKEGHNKPYVLISGGVGITPVLSMLEHLINTNTKNNIFMIIGARSPEAEAMHDLLKSYRRKHLNLFIKTIYDDGPEPYPRGPISMEQLDSMLVTRDCDYYFCGPGPMMKSIYHGLKDDWEIPEENINFEFFGPTEDL